MGQSIPDPKPKGQIMSFFSSLTSLLTSIFTPAHAQAAVAAAQITQSVANGMGSAVSGADKLAAAKVAADILLPAYAGQIDAAQAIFGAVVAISHQLNAPGFGANSAAPAPVVPQ